MLKTLEYKFETPHSTINVIIDGDGNMKVDADVSPKDKPNVFYKALDAARWNWAKGNFLSGFEQLDLICLGVVHRKGDDVKCGIKAGRLIRTDKFHVMRDGKVVFSAPGDKPMILSQASETIAGNSVYLSISDFDYQTGDLVVVDRESISKAKKERLS